MRHEYNECGLMKKYLLEGLGGIQPPANTADPKAQTTKRHIKLAEREVYVAAPTVPSYLQWSESVITFDRANHPDHVPHQGRLPLVIMPIIGKKRLSRVLMDRGNGLDIVRADTLNALGIKRSDLWQTQAPFYGVVHGKSVIPLGQIMLPVTLERRATSGQKASTLKWLGSVGHIMPFWGGRDT